jgi:hypothetical protein
MNTQRQQIGAVLVGDATLAALATGGVHYSVVTRQSAEPPFCIFHNDGGSEQWSAGGAGVERDLWTVKGASPKASEADDIDSRCRVLLDNASLGAGNLFCRRLTGVAYSETEDGETTFYRGSQYEVVYDAS